MLKEELVIYEGKSDDDTIWIETLNQFEQGTLKSGKVVAVKKLTLRPSNKVDEEFESEVNLISNVHHRNLVRLLGYCSKGNQRILVYEYMKNTSLDKFLFGKFLSNYLDLYLF